MSEEIRRLRRILTGSDLTVEKCVDMVYIISARKRPLFSCFYEPNIITIGGKNGSKEFDIKKEAASFRKFVIQTLRKRKEI
jgi:hypothetical protein